MAPTRLTALLALLSAAAALCTAHARSTTINVGVKAQWPSWPSSPVLEASEFIADRDASLFTQFAESVVADVADAGPVAVRARDADAWTEAAVEAATALVDAQSLKLLRLALAVRSHSPAVELHRQLAEASAGRRACGDDATVWADVWGAGGDPSAAVAVCDVSKLHDALKKAAVLTPSANGGDGDGEGSEPTAPADDGVFDFDHVMVDASGVASDLPPPTLVVYGALSSPSLGAFHAAAKEAANSGKATYILRHAPPVSAATRGGDADAGVQTDTPLQGFGITLDIKNMEYKALDDRAPDEDGGEGDDDSDDDSDDLAGELDAQEEPVEGVLFDALAKRKPELAAELEEVKAALKAAAAAAAGGDGGEEGEIKVWDLKDLGLQASQFIHAASLANASSSAARDPLRQLQHVSGNLPATARWLSKMKVSSDLEGEVQANQRMGMAPTQNQLLINGERVDITAAGFNIFNLLAKLGDEATVQGEMRRLPLSPPDVAALKRLQTGASTDSYSNPVRIEVRRKSKGVVTFVNDVESDEMFAAWPQDIEGVLQPTWQLHQIRKNLYTLVLVFDPTSETGFATLQQVFQYARMGAPLRFGVVLASPEMVARGVDAAYASPNDEGDFDELDVPDDKEPATVDHVLMLLRAASAHDSAAGAAFLTAVANRLEPGFSIGRLKETYAVSVTRSTGAWTKTAATEEAEATLTDGDGDGRGAVAKTSQFLHARGVPASGCTLVNGRLLDSLDLQEAMSFVYSDMHVIQNKVRRGQLTNSDHVYATLLRGDRVLPRYNEAVLGPETFVSMVSDEGFGLSKLLRYAHRPGSEDDLKPVSLVLAHDLNSAAGLRALRAALAFVSRADDVSNKMAGKARLAVVHTGATAHDAGSLGAKVASVWGEAAAVARPKDMVPLMQQVVAAALDAATEIEDAASGKVVDDNQRGDDEKTAKKGKKQSKKKGKKGKKSTRKDRSLAQVTTDAMAAFHEAVEAAAESTLRPNAQKRVAAVTRDVTGGPVEVNAAAFTRTLVKRAGLGAPVGVMLVNGRALSLDDMGELIPEDVELMVTYERTQRGDAIVAFADSVTLVDVDPDDLTADFRSDVAMRCAAALGRYDQSKRGEVPLQHLGGKHTRFTSGGGSEGEADAEDPVFDVVAVLDPVSEAAQRAAPLLLLLRDSLGARVTVQLNPTMDLSELPLKNFYRFVAGVGAQPPSTSGGGASVASPSASARSLASFSNLPRQILTMKIETPESWIVQATTAPQDLDNLRLDEKDFGARFRRGVMGVEYTLRSVLVAGQCDDLTHGRPPNGLQLELLPAGSSAVHTDTLVMQNLGYYQLQANPGVWDLRLAPGRASDLYEIVAPSADEEGGGGLVYLGWRGAAAVAGELPSVASRTVVVRDFSGPITQLRVRKREGMEDALLLEQGGADEGAGGGGEGDGEGKGLWNRLFGSTVAEAEGDDGDDDTIHVFSLASGHLYERFLKIMMLSVTRRASQPVKFWLVENFLSPGFKEMVPAMAEKYGFEVGLVTYKWPNWLRQQTEKQRIIWGYKILFLDVLFPLSVKKVIYVDADQVVRADLKELWDMDLEGAAYGYTPFCTSREETLGFQFWQSGYWKEHLDGRPYHISALYVVDLQRFRARAVGDQLRGIYDNLSRDPNSLSNLDQDLPNYAQHQVPIFSLPIEWLWCESWCSDDTKPASKTIDLCNNPLHKEPKLDMARRVISGELFPESWVELDEELASFDRDFAAAAADVRVVEDAAEGPGADGEAEL